MSWDRLVRVAAPAAMPIDTAAAKAHLRVDCGDYDDLIEAFIAAAVDRIDGPHGIGVCMVQQTWRLSLDSFYPDYAGHGCGAFFGWPGSAAEMRLPLGPVTSVDSIEYVDASGATVTLDPAAYLVDLDRDPARLVPAYGLCWPVARCQPGAVKITFKAGAVDVDDVPPTLIAAVKLMVGDLYANREAVVIDASRVTVVVNPTVERLLGQYRVLF